MNQIPVVLLGAGGHAKVLLDILLLKNLNILGIYDVNLNLKGNKVFDISVLGSDDEIFQKYKPDHINLINAIGTNLDSVREKVYNKFKNANYQFHTLIHPHAYIAKNVAIDEGVQVMAGCVIQPDTKIGKNVIINTRSSIDHDCIIESHAHIAPGVTCCGGVKIGRGSHIGAGATIRENITIGEYSFIAAGAVVVKDIPAQTKVCGIPAKIME